LQKDEKTTTTRCQCLVVIHNKLKTLLIMSHAKNVEAFEKLLGICTGYGEQYNPGQPQLRVENLTTLFNRARTALWNVNAAKTNFENATNSREVAFKEISELATRILAELKSTGALVQTVDDARGMVRKIKGYTVTNRAPIPSAKAMQQEMPQTSALSHASGTDFGSITYHFEKLLLTIASESLYLPTTAVLQVQNLQGRLNQLRQKNAIVIETSAVLGKVRRERNALLYGLQGSLYSTAMAVKQQTRAIFGYKNEAARAAWHIRFTKATIK
jgi:hypothetical protein